MKPYVTVVIPTKNGMPHFSRVLNKVLSQKTSWPFDVIIIDSGSRDGTLKEAGKSQNVRILQVRSVEFGHGRTRNQAIKETDADYVALLTQDAEPVDESWLRTLVATIEKDSRIAGVFGKHIAYPDASAFIKRDLEQHFAAFLTLPLIVHRDLNPIRYAEDILWRQLLHFYSDNNSCLRRAVWKSIPYPDVEFAEDQIWAKEIIEAGYAKAYAPDAVVYHSHDYGVMEKLGRSFDESKNFKRLFGYTLAPNIRSASRSIAALTYRDFTFDPPNEKIGILSRLCQIAMNFALVAGHYLGSHHEAIPIWLQNQLSRDGALKRQ